MTSGGSLRTPGAAPGTGSGTARSRSRRLEADALGRIRLPGDSCERDKDGTFRVFYVATIDETVYVLHAFQKKTQKTSNADLDLARQRYGEIGNER